MSKKLRNSNEIIIIESDESRHVVPMPNGYEWAERDGLERPPTDIMVGASMYHYVGTQDIPVYRWYNKFSDA